MRTTRGTSRFHPPLHHSKPLKAISAGDLAELCGPKRWGCRPARPYTVTPNITGLGIAYIGGR